MIEHPDNTITRYGAVIRHGALPGHRGLSRNELVVRTGWRHSLRCRLWIYFALVFCGGIWGLVPTLAKSAIADGAHPFGLTWWQAVGGGAIVLAISVARGKGLPLDRQHLGFYAFCGVVGTIIPTLALFYSAPYVAAGIVAILMAAVPIAAYPLSLATGIDRLQIVRVLGLGLGLAGVAMLILPGSDMNVSDPIWILIALLMPLGYASGNVFVAIKSPRHTESTTLVAGMLLMGAYIHD